MKNNAAVHETLDLGLLTRILCHEMNNLLASQQGFLKLLARGHSDPATLVRWNSEVAQANQSLQGLVKSIQTWVHSDFDPESTPDPELEKAIEAVADHAIELGGDIPFISLSRLLFLLTLRPEVHPTLSADWSVKVEPGPAEGGVLYRMSQAHSYLCITLPFETDPHIAQDMEHAASRILPTPNGTRDEWTWALIVGLLRQHSGDLRLIEIQHNEASLPVFRLQVLVPITRQGKLEH